MSETFDIVYSAEHTDRRLIDVFVPDGERNGAAIYFIHGGGFVFDAIHNVQAGTPVENFMAMMDAIRDSFT